MYSSFVGGRVGLKVYKTMTEPTHVQTKIGFMVMFQVNLGWPVARLSWGIQKLCMEGFSFLCQLCSNLLDVIASWMKGLLPMQCQKSLCERIVLCWL